jgi:multiple sugar transport system permease protein
LGLLIALFLGALYLVIVRPSAARTGRAERDDPVDDGSLRSRPAAWTRLVPIDEVDREVMPNRPDGTARPERRRVARGGIRLGGMRSLVSAALVAGAILTLVVWLAGPIVWIAVASTQPHSAVAHMPPSLTAALDLSGYTGLLADRAWQGAAAASITIAVLGTALALAVAILAGYPLARFPIRGTRVLLLVLLATMLFPPIALALPVLYLVIGLGVRDTVLGLVLINAAFWSPILIWLVRGAFMGVPIELERAARIDGCTRLGVIFRISLPAAAPVIAAATAIVFIGIWNDFVFAAVIGGRETHTLPRYLGENSSPLVNVFAARIVLTVAPCIVLVALLRRRIFALV